MTQHPEDLARLITADHHLVDKLFERLHNGQGDRRVLLDQVVFHLSVHAAAEEAVVYPAMREAFPDDEPVDHAEHEHQVMKEALAVIDDHDSDTGALDKALQALTEEVQHHTKEEEGEHLVRLRSAVGNDKMVELGRAFSKAELAAPSRPHPNAGTSKVAAAAAGLVDKVRDKVVDRDAEAGTDASGLLNPAAQQVVDRMASMKPLPIHLLDAETARQQPTPTDAVMAILKDRGQTDPEAVSSVENRQIPGPAGDMSIRLYRPADASPDKVLPVLVYIHGGGWVIADLDVYDATPRALANAADCMVVSVEYRHAPEAKFPAAHDDVLAATKWVFANASSINGNPAAVAICGESAGGNMAMATTMALVDEGHRPPVAQVLVYPVASTSMDTQSYGEARDAKPLYSAMMNWFFAKTVNDPAELADPRLNLVAIPTSKLASCPPTAVITAQRDPLCDEGEQLAERLRTAGVEVTAQRFDGVPHEFFGMAAVIDEAEQAQSMAAQVLKKAFRQAIQ